MKEYWVQEFDRIIKIPTTFERCSVCGIWKPFFEYCVKDEAEIIFFRENPNHENIPLTRTRTNCWDCYTLPIEKMNQLSDKTAAYYGSWSRSKKEKVETLNNAWTKKQLQEIINGLPDDHVFVKTARCADEGEYFVVLTNKGHVEEIAGIKVMWI